VKRDSLRIVDQFVIDSGSLSDENRSMLKSILVEDAKTSKTETKPKALMVKVSATHAGMLNKNIAMYIPDAMRRAAASWIDPHEKPVLTHHEKKKDAIGRVKNAEYLELGVEGLDDMETPSGYIELLVKITDSDAIQKILDERYLSVSVGMQSKNVRCSICDSNLAKNGLCEHKKGKDYNDKLCYWKISDINYTELSFVNTPADEFAKVEGISVVQDSHDVDVLGFEDSLLNDETEDTTDSNTEGEDTMTLMDQIKALIDEHEFTDEEITEFVDVLDPQLDEVLEDAKLSTAQRKKLSGGTFCGPKRSFPVPDCAHVTAARRLIGRAKVSDSTKSKILACVSKKASSLGCSAKGKSSKDEVTISDLMTAWVSDLSYVTELQDKIKDQEVQTSELNDQTTKAKKNTQSLKDTINTLSSDNRELNDKNSALESENLTLKDENEKLVEDVSALKTKRHEDLAEKAVDLKIRLGKPGAAEILSKTDPEERKTLRDEMIKEHSSRDIKSLEDSISDLVLEIGQKKTPTGTIESQGVETKERQSRPRRNSRESKQNNVKDTLFGGKK